MRRTIIAGAVIGLVATLGVVAPAQATAPTATVGLFHGVPNVPVDVYVGKTKLVDDFQPGTFAAAPPLKAGDYLIRITAADATGPKNPIIKARFHFAGGKSYSVIAHLTAKGKPTATKYVNDLSPLKSKGRVTVRHVAAAPPVDITVNRKVAIEGLVNPKQAKAKLPVGTYSVAVTLSNNRTSPVLGPVDLAIAKGTNTIVYAYGSATDDTLALATRVLPLKPYQH